MLAICNSEVQTPNGGRILVACGKDRLRGAIAGAFETAGWPVIEGRDWLEALLQAYVNNIGLAVIEEQIEGIGGRELARLLKRLQPGVRVLVISNGSSPTAGDAGARTDDWQHFSMPPTTGQLLAETIAVFGRFGVPRAAHAGRLE